MPSDNFLTHLATPMIIHADMNESEFKYEFARMQARQAATAEFVSGELDPEDFFEVLADSGVCVDTALRDWSRGLSYMG